MFYNTRDLLGIIRIGFKNRRDIGLGIMEKDSEKKESGKESGKGSGKGLEKKEETPKINPDPFQGLMHNSVNYII
jgi:hypothetical protein